MKPCIWRGSLSRCGRGSSGRGGALHLDDSGGSLLDVAGVHLDEALHLDDSRAFYLEDVAGVHLERSR